MRNYIIPRWVGCFLAAQMALPGCASYQAKPAPVPEFMPYSYSDSYLEVYADPYLQLDRQREYFDAELTKLGVIPIQVFVRNKSDLSFALHEYADIWLELPNGAQISSSPSSDFFRWKEEWELEKKWEQKQKEREQETFASGMGKAALQGALFGAFEGSLPLIIMTAPVWGPFAYMAYRSRNQAGTDRLADYHQKELSDIVLNKDESGHGFIFFVIPPHVDLRDIQTLVFRFVEEKADNTAAIRLRLNGLSEGTETVDSPHPPER